MTQLVVTVDGHIYEIEISPTRDASFPVRVNGEVVDVLIPDLNKIDLFIVNERPYEVDTDPDLRWIRDHYGLHRLEIRDLEQPIVRQFSGDGRIKAPIPGLVTRIWVRVGEHVEAGQPLLGLEAMKMENEIRTPYKGTVQTIHVLPDQVVTRNTLLVEINPEL